MAKSTSVVPVFEILPAGSDPRLPLGVWRASGGADGDATGGVHNINVELMTAAGGGVERTVFFTLDELSATKEDGTEPSGGIVTVNMAVNLDALGSGVNQYRGFATVGDGAISRLVQRDVPLPWSLGYPASGAIGTLRVVLPNTDGVTDSLMAVGHFWLADAPYLPGGTTTDYGHVELQQKPNYAVGSDAYYAKLRRGEPTPEDAQEKAALLTTIGRLQLAVAELQDPTVPGQFLSEADVKGLAAARPLAAAPAAASAARIAPGTQVKPRSVAAPLRSGALQEIIDFQQATSRSIALESARQQAASGFF